MTHKHFRPRRPPEGPSPSTTTFSGFEGGWCAQHLAHAQLAQLGALLDGLQRPWATDDNHLLRRLYHRSRRDAASLASLSRALEHRLEKLSARDLAFFARREGCTASLRNVQEILLLRAGLLARPESQPTHAPRYGSNTLDVGLFSVLVSHVLRAL